MINISFSTFIVLCSHEAEVLCELDRNVTVDFGSLNESSEHPQHICFTVWLAAIAVTFCVLIGGWRGRQDPFCRQAGHQTAHCGAHAEKPGTGAESGVLVCIYILSAVCCVCVSLWGAEWLHGWVHASVSEVSCVTL